MSQQAGHTSGSSELTGNSPDAVSLRAALLQLLETDRCLGLKSAPVAWPTVRQAAPVSPGPRTMQRAAPPSAPSSSASSLPLRPAARQPSAAIPMISGEGMDVAGKEEALRRLDQQQVQTCTKCRLSETRTKTVFGQGHPDARLVFVGEGPGFEEDRQGLAFVGRAGQLLTDIIVKGMGLTREDVFICNIVKCRPPGNRDPQADEILACNPYLQQQLMIIQPEVVVALGAPASKTLLGTAQSIGKLRGRFHDFYPSGTSGSGMSIPLMPTYHPAYLLRNPSEKGKTWDDIQMVMKLLGIER
ncbi:MAG: uracil-DNA glycosylase [Phycisphaerae bacterium]